MANEPSSNLKSALFPYKHYILNQMTRKMASVIFIGNGNRSGELKKA